MLHVFDGHFNDLGLLDATAALLQVGGRDESGQVGQTVVHAIATPLLDYAVRQGILKNMHQLEFPPFAETNISLIV